MRYEFPPSVIGPDRSLRSFLRASVQLNANRIRPTKTAKGISQIRCNLDKARAAHVYDYLVRGDFGKRRTKWANIGSIDSRPPCWEGIIGQLKLLLMDIGYQVSKPIVVNDPPAQFIVMKFGTVGQ